MANFAAHDVVAWRGVAEQHYHQTGLVPHPAVLWRMGLPAAPAVAATSD